MPNEAKSLEGLPDLSSELTNKEDRVLRGVALWQMGHSVRYAAEQVGCSHPAIIARAKSLGIDIHNPEPPKRLELMRRLGSILEEATRQLQEALDAGRIKESQLPVVAGIFTDKLSNLSGWNRAGGEGAAEFLQAFAERLCHAESVTLSIKDKPPDADAITVEALPEASAQERDRAT